MKFQHSKGKVIRDGLKVTLIVTEESGKDRIREERTYETPERADAGYWDAVSWLRGLRG